MNPEYPRRESQPPLEIPLDKLSEEVLSSLIESFVLREGTDYGVHEVQLSTKIEQIRKQVVRGDILITFDPNTESVTLLTKPEWRKLISKFSDSTETRTKKL